MNFKLTGLKAYDKKRTKIKLLLKSDDGVSAEYIISEGTYREIGCPLSGDLIPEELLEAVSEEDEAIRADKKASAILAFADNSTARLKMKLRRAGFSAKATEKAVESLTRAGLLDDRRQVKLRIENLWRYKLLGPARIIAKLSAEGYSVTLIKSSIKDLEASVEIDFKKSKHALLEKHAPDSYEERQKLLYKYGNIYD